MHIDRLELYSFRNYRRRSFEPSETLTVLVGPNAAGKTNVIEAIQLITTGVSFRRPRWEETVSWGADEARVTMEAAGNQTHASVELGVSAAGARTWRVNGVTKRRVTDATGIVPSVTFTPDDLSLAKGSAEQRRDALDALGSQLSRAYAAARREYGRVVRQRNALLKEGGGATLEAWDAQLVSLGARVLIHRIRLARRLADAMAPVYSRLAAGEALTLTYADATGLGSLPDEVSAEAAERALTGALESRREDELARGTTLVGPHRDDVALAISGRDARTFGSQGQQRTVALAWKWAEIEVVQAVTGKRPVFLLDDVMSELDEARRAALTDLVQRDIQTFITTTNTGYFDPALLDSATTVRIGDDE